jgi:hypothetical protein
MQTPTIDFLMIFRNSSINSPILYKSQCIRGGKPAEITGLALPAVFWQNACQ